MLKNSNACGFKMIELDTLPEEWQVVRLGDDAIAEIRGNKTINMFEKVAFIPMDFVPDSGIFVKYEMRPMEDVKSFTYCERGDLLLAKITPSLENGKQGIVPDNIPNGFALATTEVFPISCKGIDRLFLFYVLKFPKFRNKIISSMIGTTGRQRASKKSVENLQIPLPPLPEQRRIAEVLGTVDSAIQKVGGAIERTERLKKGLMQRLLTRGIISGFMFDTTVFNNILDKKIDIERFPKKFNYFITHVQHDELDKTTDTKRKNKLFQIFQHINKNEIPTESAVFGISIFGEAKFGDGKILEELRKDNLKHTEDALIGETAIKNGLILITNDETLLNRVRKLKGQAIILEDFLNRNYKEFKDSKVGRIPEEWDVIRLGDIADDFVGGGTPSTSNPNYWNGKIAWMTSAHISGRVVTSGQRYITEKGLNESSTHLIPEDNLLVATRVGIGKAATNSIDIAISQDLTGVIIKKDKIIVDYAYWFLINNSSRLKSLAQGSTIKGILKDDLANFKLPLPPLPEQRRIAEILSAADRKLERRRKEKLERVKKGLMSELLTGRKRVKIMAEMG